MLPALLYFLRVDQRIDDRRNGVLRNSLPSLFLSFEGHSIACLVEITREITPFHVIYPCCHTGY